MGVSEMKRPAVFLDRDGVLNRVLVHPDGKTHPPAAPQELEILPGVAEACKSFKEAGFLLIVVTNQPDVARGTQSQEVIEEINKLLQSKISVDEIRVCYHDTRDNCGCRKPKPGLLQAAARSFGIDFSKSYMIGDRWTDIEAGRAAGCKTVLISDSPPKEVRSRPDFQAKSLADAAKWILKWQ